MKLLYVEHDGPAQVLLLSFTQLGHLILLEQNKFRGETGLGTLGIEWESRARVGEEDRVRRSRFKLMGCVSRMMPLGPGQKILPTPGAVV